MQIFKLYFQIIKKNITTLLIYVAVFLALVVVMSMFTESASTPNYEREKPNVTIYDNSTPTEYSKYFKEYISEYINIVEVPDNETAMQDALYYMKTDYVIRIPENFTANIFNEDVSQGQIIERVGIINSSKTIYLDNLINRFINLSKMYIKNLHDIPQKDLIETLKYDLGKIVTPQVDTSISNIGNVSDKTTSNYFTYYAYPIILIILLGVTTVTMRLNKKDIRSRNLSSPVKVFKYNLGLILGNIIFVVIVWAMFMIISLFLTDIKIFSINTLLLFINALILSITVLGIAFLLSKFIKTNDVQTMVANVVGLGLAFLSGVFVPQALLAGIIVKISKFMPVYWYIDAVKKITTLTNYSRDNIMDICKNFGIQLGFCALFIILGICLMNKVTFKKKKSNKVVA